MKDNIKFIKPEYSGSDIQYDLLADGITLFARNIVGTYNRNIGDKLIKQEADVFIEQSKNDLYKSAGITD